MNFPLKKFEAIETPFYYYDTKILKATLNEVKKATADEPDYIVHYAVKANSNPALLDIIAKEGFGADCVSGGEIKMCLQAGIPGNKIVFAGVGKKDWEINLGIENDILCFNVESIPELEIINELAAKKNKIANIAFRINPNVDAHTHAKITTGLNENKFGISLDFMTEVIRLAKSLKNIHFTGLHFHIGSQLLDNTPFALLSEKINKIQEQLENEGLNCTTINVGGGLGIDYNNPEEHIVPDFNNYFETFKKHLKLREGQTLHFELGRSIVGQCGFLVSRALYVKKGINKKFLIIDAGFTDLIRPALYDAYHKITNISSDEKEEKYDVVGPICESSDVFVKDYSLPKSKRGDFIVLHSAGAYGEVMASQYNCREIPQTILSE